MGGSFPCSVAAHCAAEADIIRLNAHVVSRVFSVSLSSGRPSNVTNSPKRGQQRRTLVDNSTSWRAPSPSLPSSLLTKQRKVQSGRSAPPLSSNVSNVDANVEDLKISKTRQSKAFFFRFDAPTSRTLKLNSSPSLVSSSMPPLRESSAPLIPNGFAVFIRCVMQLASRGARRARWPAYAWLAGRGRGRGTAAASSPACSRSTV